MLSNKEVVEIVSSVRRRSEAAKIGETVDSGGDRGRRPVDSGGDRGRWPVDRRRSLEIVSSVSNGATLPPLSLSRQDVDFQHSPSTATCPTHTVTPHLDLAQRRC